MYLGSSPVAPVKMYIAGGQWLDARFLRSPSVIIPTQSGIGKTILVRQLFEAHPVFEPLQDGHFDGLYVSHPFKHIILAHVQVSCGYSNSLLKNKYFRDKKVGRWPV